MSEAPPTKPPSGTDAIPDGPRTREPWRPTDPPPSPRRTRKHLVVDALRDVIARVTQLDVEAVDEHDLEDIETTVDRLRDRLGHAPDLRRHGGAALAPGVDSALFERSPLTGRSNPIATPLILSFDGDRTIGRTIFGEAYEGPPGTVHGGFVVAAFDDLLGVAQSVSGAAGLTGTLTVRLRRPTPLHRRIDYEAGVDRREGRKIVAWGCSYHDGDLLAEAEGLFITRRAS